MPAYFLVGAVSAAIAGFSGFFIGGGISGMSDIIKYGVMGYLGYIGLKFMKVIK